MVYIAILHKYARNLYVYIFEHLKFNTVIITTKRFLRDINYSHRSLVTTRSTSRAQPTGFILQWFLLKLLLLFFFIATHKTVDYKILINTQLVM